MEIQKYTFRRRAFNESYSGRTAKAAKPFTGRLKDAIRKGMNLSQEIGVSITIHDSNDTVIASILYWGLNPTTTTTNRRVSINILYQYMDQLLADR